MRKPQKMLRIFRGEACPVASLGRMPQGRYSYE